MPNLIPTLERYAKDGHLVEEFHNFPRGRYITILVARKTESETIFRTEGGDDLVEENTLAGNANTRLLRRVVISKRKQTAVERRKGRELLRDMGHLKQSKKGECSLNVNAPCGKCVDCMLYGFAVGQSGEDTGSQKSRVLTQDAFSIDAASKITDTRVFNAPLENGTMWNPETKKTSSAIQESIRYVRPETHFLDMETLKDVMPGELAYVLGNLLRSTRYGAISSRMGRIRNRVLALVCTDCELFSNLELTQAVYDHLAGAGKEGDLAFPLTDDAVNKAALSALDELLPSVMSRQPLVLRGGELEAVLEEVTAVYRTPEGVRELLSAIEKGYPSK